MNLNSRKSLIARLRRSKAARKQFIESHIAKTIANQIRATRDQLKWSQERLADEAGMNQNAISRLESSDYGKPTITTLKRLAASMDVGLMVRFVPFSEMIDWVSATPRTIEGLTTSALAVPNFEREESEGIFQESIPTPVTRNEIGTGAANNAGSTQPVDEITSSAGLVWSSPAPSGAANSTIDGQQSSGLPFDRRTLGAAAAGSALHIQ